MRERETIKNLLKAHLYLEAYFCSLDFAHSLRTKPSEYLHFIKQAYLILDIVQNPNHRPLNR